MRKRVVWGLAILSLLAILGISQGYFFKAPSVSFSTPTPTATPIESKCDSTPWNNVYHPSRLRVIDDCKTVKGVVDAVYLEKDGDYHILLKPDSEFSDLVNEANIKKQMGDIVVEIICAGPVTQKTAKDACANYKNSVEIPAKGNHIKVTGSYVLDEGHEGWSEIHPVTSLEVN